MDPGGDIEMDHPRSITMPSKALWQRKRELYDELRVLLKRAAKPRDSAHTGFEYEMDRLVDTKDIDLLRLLESAITWSMLTGRGCRFSEQNDLFDELLDPNSEEKRRVTLPDIIVTLNYDMLLEEALRRCGIDFYYPALEENRRGVALYKLHGSINWRQVKPYAGSADPEVAKRQAQANHTRWVPSDRKPDLWTTETPNTSIVLERSALILELKQATNTQNTVMAVYGNNKPVATNQACVRQHREACRDHVVQLVDADVTVIGIRFQQNPSDDPDLDFLARALGRSSGKRVFVNPDSTDCEVASRLGFDTRREVLDKFLCTAR
jgi:hypothetical protein